MMQQSHGEIDQRRFQRYGVNFPCTVRPVHKHKGTKSSWGTATAIESETKDVSTGGLYFEASSDWKVGTEIECLLQLPVKAFGRQPVAIRCRGKIARVTQKAPGIIGVGATIEQSEFQYLEKNDASDISPFASWWLSLLSKLAFPPTNLDSIRRCGRTADRSRTAFEGL